MTLMILTPKNIFDLNSVFILRKERKYYVKLAF